MVQDVNGGFTGDICRGTFSGWPTVIGWLAMLLFAFHACTHVIGGDSPWSPFCQSWHRRNRTVQRQLPRSRLDQPELADSCNLLRTRNFTGDGRGLILMSWSIGHSRSTWLQSAAYASYAGWLTSTQDHWD